MSTMGTITSYHGTEHRYLRGYKVRIIGVIKADGQYIRDDDELQQAGGVQPEDRLEVQPWIEKAGRFSFVSSDPRAIDLACFAHLAKSHKKGGRR